MSGTERSVAGRTSKRLDPFGMAMLAISHQCMDGSVCDAEVGAVLVGTSEAGSGYASGGLPAGFSPHSMDVASAEEGLTLGEGVEAR